MAPQEPRRGGGTGSGVIVTRDGYIITNNHVVEGATDVKVTLSDRRELTAKVIGTDPRTDVAVIKIDANNLSVLPISDSTKVQVGDVALAMGNPFGIGQTVTMGIISATGRGGLNPENYEDFIQTDAAINPAIRAALWSTPADTDRYQHRDPLPNGWQPGCRLCDPDQHGS